MRIQKLNILILVCSILTSTNALAQIVDLTCTKRLTKEFLDNFPKFWEGQCTKYAGKDCDRAQEARAQVKFAWNQNYLTHTKENTRLIKMH
jgi:hypothetical protein